MTDYKADEDAPIVEIMKREGAIPMVRGNVPQLVYIMHSDNNIYGCSKNPFDDSRTCGGSSGGDAGLVGARCIPLAIGSDIGGSIRGPALMCGIYGFKSTP
jgi:Asp-tRNA(Asn)/Glu-tRNA(Gln) amidotransferase A subunit family amidase